MLSIRRYNVMAANWHFNQWQQFKYTYTQHNTQSTHKHSLLTMLQIACIMRLDTAKIASTYSLVQSDAIFDGNRSNEAARLHNIYCYYYIQAIKFIPVRDAQLYQQK